MIPFDASEEHGAGKSTLFRCLAGWLEPDDGQVYVMGEPFDGRTRLAPGMLAFAPDVPSFYDDLTAAEHVELVLAANRAEGARPRAERLLERFGLAGYETLLPSAYSRGMREKLALVLALMLRPRVMLLDEPHGPLDREASLVLSEKLAAAAREGSAVVIAAAGIGLAVASGYLASLVPNALSPVVLLAVCAADLLMLAGAVNCAGRADMAFVIDDNELYAARRALRFLAFADSGAYKEACRRRRARRGNQTRRTWRFRQGRAALLSHALVSLVRRPASLLSLLSWGGPARSHGRAGYGGPTGHRRARLVALLRGHGPALVCAALLDVLLARALR